MKKIYRSTVHVLLLMKRCAGARRGNSQPGAGQYPGILHHGCRHRPVWRSGIWTRELHPASIAR